MNDLRYCHPKTTTCSGNESMDTKDCWPKWIFGKRPGTVNLIAIIWYKSILIVGWRKNSSRAFNEISSGNVA